MATKEQKQALADTQSDQQKAEAEALAADPIGGKPPIDVAHERALENAEPLGYVDPESQKVPDNYAPDPKDVENPPARQPRQRRGKAGVTRDDAKGSDNA
jgi:hypothetical protein